MADGGWDPMAKRNQMIVVGAKGKGCLTIDTTEVFEPKETLGTNGARDERGKGFH